MIDTAEGDIRKELDDLDAHERLEIRRAILGTGIHSISDALPALCSTPRALKLALRAALETWERLPGEIDIDDLMAMSMIRESSLTSLPSCENMWTPFGGVASLGKIAPQPKKHGKPRSRTLQLTCGPGKQSRK